MSTNPHSDDKRLLELLERWQSGDFTRADEQELQSLADSDEFRREAVAGFWAFPESDHAVYLASIRSRLHKRNDGGIRVSMPKLMAAIAAMGLLVLAVVWLIPGSKETSPLAQESLPRPVEQQPIASNLPVPETKDEEIRSPENHSVARSMSKTAGGQQSAVMDAGPSANNIASEASSSPAPAVMNKQEEVADKMLAAKPVVKETEYSKAMDDQSDVDLKPGNAAAPARSEAMGSAQAKDSMKKKVQAAGNTAQPAGGWNKFQDYLRRNARLPEAARQNNISGTIRLKFRLDDQNQATDFIILRSLGFGCDEEAIRLIKAYNWQGGSTEALTLDVPFVR